MCVCMSISCVCARAFLRQGVIWPARPQDPPASPPPGTEVADVCHHALLLHECRGIQTPVLMENCTGRALLVSRLPSPVLAFYLTRLLGCWHKYTAQRTLSCILDFSLRSHGNIGLLDSYHSLTIVSHILDFLSSQLKADCRSERRTVASACCHPSPTRSHGFHSLSFPGPFPSFCFFFIPFPQGSSLSVFSFFSFHLAFVLSLLEWTFW